MRRRGTSTPTELNLTKQQAELLGAQVKAAKRKAEGLPMPAPKRAKGKDTIWFNEAGEQMVIPPYNEMNQEFDQTWQEWVTTRQELEDKSQELDTTRQELKDKSQELGSTRQELEKMKSRWQERETRDSQSPESASFSYQASCIPQTATADCHSRVLRAHGTENA